MIIKNVKAFNPKGFFEDREIYTRGELLVADGQDAGGGVIDGRGCFAVPGLIDIHFHGCMGVDFCNGTEAAIEKMAEYEAVNGVTAICPATMTLSEEEIGRVCDAAKAYSNKKGAILCGINMEGPFISREKKGAQNEAYIHHPDTEVFKRLQARAGGLIRLVDIAPETECAMDFIQAVKDEVCVSVAHTTADYDIAKKAFELGARHVTHLYNAMPPFSHRAPGVIGAACDAPEVRAELICDGVHIHPSVVRTTFKMFGDDRIVMISDSMEATGMADGQYQLGGQAVKVVGSLATLADGTIAGSATNLMDCVRQAVLKMGIPLESAIKCASVNPAKAIGVYEQYGSLEPGKIANIVLLDEQLNLAAVILKGEKITGTL